VFTQVGSQATAATNLWQVQDLTGSAFSVGLVGLVEGVAIVGLGPVAGHVADRLDRRRVMQTAQGVAAATSVGLAALTFTGTASPAFIYAAAVVAAA
jgi:MFS family permease